MAKGVEDTALDAWPGLFSLNEVGGDPRCDGMRVADFHREMTRRARTAPRALNTTGTHDTERGEDIRARLNVLTEISGEWVRRVESWRRANRRAAIRVRGAPVPHEDEELSIYQTLVGSWPVDGCGLTACRKRLGRYLVKAARESKRCTSWIAPDPGREEALVRFVERILDDPAHTAFRRSFEELATRIGPAGAVNGLTQVLLRSTTPGVPDLYQGAELWDQRFVDPDNRRPVDFDARRRHPDLMRAGDARAGARARSLMAAWRNGRIRLLVTWRSLEARRARPALHARGRYVPIRVTGSRSRHLCCFARVVGGEWALTVPPLRVMAMMAGGGFPLGRAAWADTALVVPRGAPVVWTDTLGGATRRTRGGRGRRVLDVVDLLDTLPVALLEGGRAR